MKVILFLHLCRYNIWTCNH